MGRLMPCVRAVSLPWDWLSLRFLCVCLNTALQEPGMWVCLNDTVFLQEFSSWLIPVKEALFVGIFIYA